MDGDKRRKWRKRKGKRAELKGKEEKRNKRKQLKSRLMDEYQYTEMVKCSNDYLQVEKYKQIIKINIFTTGTGMGVLI